MFRIIGAKLSGVSPRGKRERKQDTIVSPQDRRWRPCSISVPLYRNAASQRGYGQEFAVAPEVFAQFGADEIATKADPWKMQSRNSKPVFWPFRRANTSARS